MLMKGVTLRGLEVFEALARTGSVAQTAEMSGLSRPAVSQQLRNLEKALAADLIDHSRRPMVLTPAGQTFLTRTEAVLSELRLAQSELTVVDLSHLPALTMGLIDDFDNDLTPRLVSILADSLTKCRFEMITAPRHGIIRAMTARELHIAVAASVGSSSEGTIEFPLVKDPFILVAPKGFIQSHASGSSQVDIERLRTLPFLRHASEQLISQQIQTHLEQQAVSFESRFEIGSHLALMAMVARRVGWTITTPLGLMRAARFHDQIEAHPLPFGRASRTISLFSSSDWADSIPRDVSQTMRHLIQNQTIEPALARFPWLTDDFHVLGP